MLRSFAFFFSRLSRDIIYSSAPENDDITDPHQNYNTVSKFNEETIYLKELIQYIKYLLHYKYTTEREHKN